MSGAMDPENAPTLIGLILAFGLFYGIKWILDFRFERNWKPTLRNLLKNKKIKPKELANQLDIDVKQIHEWDKEDFSRDNPYYEKLRELIPEIDKLIERQKLERNLERQRRYYKRKR